MVQARLQSSALFRLERAKEGSIEFMGSKLTDMSAPEIVKLGISHVPEGRRVFTSMSVLENLELGAYLSQNKQSRDKNLRKYLSISPSL